VTPDTLDLIGGWASLVLTLLVFSYLLGDNVLYRLAVYLLVGAAAGYTVVVAVESVLLPWLNETLLVEAAGREEAAVTALRAIGTMPFLFGALLLFKYSPRLAPVGDLGLAFIIGVGVAVALVGAVAGTLVPLVRETADSMADDTLDGVVMVVGVTTTLLFFQYLAVERAGRVGRPRWLQPLSLVGQVFITLTLAALYAGAILTSLAIFSDVIRQQLEFILDRVGG
jgi:hypothetical protein